MQEVNEKRESNMTGIQIGISSLLLIFTVVCIVIFCVLSFSSARADYALAQKSLKATQAYYAADVKGEEIKKDVNEAIISLAGESESQFRNKLKEKFGENYDAEGNEFIFSIDTAYDQVLHIKIIPNAASEIAKDKQNFKIKEWQILNKEEYEISTDMPVWTGE